ncbi:MAG: AAA family ATPase [Candidatus Aenigmarchaeota archaeon]|nr:AAA family ATPase [Candidatus Aenigmarchaeota archaeon]
MQNDYEYFTKFNWNSNPFTLTIDPQLMVGYSEQTNSLLSHVHNLHKFALISGPTGSGKTTLMLWLRSQLMAFKKFNPYYISKPPKSSKELVMLFKSFLGFNIIDKIRYGDLSLFDLQKFVIRKLRNKQFVLLIDESHESSVANLEWIRTIADSIPNLYVIFAGLPVFEKNIETQLPTIFMRITTKTYLNNLSRPETETLIQKRIENSGGEGLKPFASDAVDRIYEITGGFPREIIKTCDKLVKEAAEKNITNINRSFIDQVIKTSETTEPVEMQAPLSQKQKEILEILNKNPDLTPSQIISHFPVEEYKDRDNAVRSINNILKRLVKDELIQRKKLGNSYVYFLTGKAKTVFTEA